MAKRVTKVEREEAARIIRRLIDALDFKCATGSYLAGHADALARELPASAESGGSTRADGEVAGLPSDPHEDGV